MPAIRSHSTATVDRPWDGPRNVAKLKLDQDAAFYDRMYAWRDPDKEATTKAAYKLPHHEVDGEGNPGAANVRGCIAAIQRLNGNVNIPAADRQASWNHAARHLRDADMEPAPLRTVDNVLFEERTWPVELRIEQRESEMLPLIVGHSAVFNSPTEMPWGFREQFSPGAFAKTLDEQDIRMLFNHDPNFVLGRNRSGTLVLREDEHGLYEEVQPPDAEWARALIASIERGDIDQQSIGFRAIRELWEEKPGGIVLRTIQEAQLRDTSVVTFPAYEQTDAYLRELRSLGIMEISNLGRCLLRTQHGLSLEGEDLDLIKTTIERLSLVVAPGEAAHPTEGTETPCDPPEVAAPADNGAPPKPSGIVTLQRRLRLLKAMG